MRDENYAPYIDFLDEFGAKVNFGNPKTIALLDDILRGYNGDMTTYKQADMGLFLFDEVCAFIRGNNSSISGFEITPDMFYDYDNVVLKLQSIANKYLQEKVNASRFSRSFDSAGRNLTEDQAEYFKDSKVRDDDGNLMPVYHGTDAAIVANGDESGALDRAVDESSKANMEAFEEDERRAP